MPRMSSVLLLFVTLLANDFYLFNFSTLPIPKDLFCVCKRYGS